MKTSPELLTDILGVLGKIEQRMGAKTASVPGASPGVKSGDAATIASILAKTGAGEKMAEDIEKLKKAMSGKFIKNLTTTVEKLKEYNQLSKETSKAKNVSGWALAAQDTGKAMMYIAGGILVLSTSISISSKLLGVKPIGLMGYILLTSATLGLSIMIISAADGAGEAIRASIMNAGSKGGKNMNIPSVKMKNDGNKGAIENAKRMGIALMYIAGGILVFSTSLVAAKNIMGTRTILGLMGNILLVIAVLGLSIIILSTLTAVGELIANKIGGGGKGGGGMAMIGAVINGKTAGSQAVINAQKIGIALMYIAGGILSFAVSMNLSKDLLDVETVGGIAGRLLLIVGAIGLSMLILTILGSFAKSGVKNAKDMGLALFYIAGGILSFAVMMHILPDLLDEDTLKGSLLSIGFVIASLFGMMVVLNVAGKLVQGGVKTAKGIGLALILMSVGILVVALVSKVLLAMFKTTTIDEKGKKQKSGPFAAFSEATSALGIFGLFVAGLAGILWLLGLPFVSGPIILGSTAMIMMAWGLLRTTKAIKAVNNVMKEIGGKEGMKVVSDSIRLMISGIIGGVVSGVMGKDEISKLKDSDIKAKDIRQFRKISRIMKILGKMSNSLTQFAKGLRAFSKLGEIATLDYEYKTDKETGVEVAEPKIGEKIPLTTIVKSITSTLNLFIKGLADGIHTVKNRNLRKLELLGEVLTGKKGLVSGIVDFSRVLQEFAKYGKNQEAWVPREYINPNLEGTALDKPSNKVPGTGVSVPLLDIVQSIVTSFGKFVQELAAKAPQIQELGRIKMKKFNEALVGKKGRRGRETPGILDAIIAFSSTITEFSKFGANGVVPLYDEEGRPKLNAEGKRMGVPIKTIVSNMVGMISKFMTELQIATSDGALNEKAKQAKKNINVFTSVITEFEKLANAQQGIERLSTTLGSLAGSMQKLTESTSKLDVSKIQALAIATPSGEGTATPAPQTTQKRGASRKNTTETSSEAGVGYQDWDKIGEIIADKIAAKLAGVGSGEFKFSFYDETSGVVEIKKK